MNTPTYTADMVGTADYVWRIVLMFGAIPALLTFYWRMRMAETARYTALVGRNLKQAVSDMNKVLDIDINDLTEEEDANMLARQDTGLLEFAECPKHSANHLKHSANGSPSVTLGEQHSSKKSDGKANFAECFLSGTRQSLCRVPDTRQS